jgi:type II secretory pathway pseudopilin PulG
MLIELLVVIAIMGILAAVALPKIGAFGKSNATVSATRQLLDDISLARSMAVSRRSDVYMVFIPPMQWLNESGGNYDLSLLNDADRTVATRLLAGQYTTYALYAERTVGDQPGRNSPRYLTPWKTLPQGAFIATNKFVKPANPQTHKNNNDGISAFEYIAVPFPQATNSVRVQLPCIVFSSRGQLTTTRDDGGETIPLARGSIFYPRDVNGQVASPFTADVAENPPNNSRTNTSMWNWIHIDALTGRARVERQEIQ